MGWIFRNKTENANIYNCFGLKMLFASDKRMKRNLFPLIGLIGLFLMLSFPLFGQSYRAFHSDVQNILKKKSRFKFGPFRIYPQIHVRDIGYDGNVFRQQKADNPVSDYTATFSPVIQVNSLLSDWIILSLEENPEYVHYIKVKRERAWNNSITSGIKLLLLKRFVLSGRYYYSRRKRRGTSEFDVRARERSSGYTGRFFFETARGSMLGLTGSVQKISYEDINLPGEEISLSKWLNREERSGAAEFYYRLFSRSDFFITAGYTLYRFQNESARWRDSYSYQVYTGLRFPLLGRMRGTLSVGYKEFSPEAKELKGFSGLVGNASLNYRTGRFAFRMGLSRDSQFSYWTTNVYYIENRYTPGISFYLTRFLKLDYNLSYGENRYSEPDILRYPDGRAEEVKRRDVYKTQSLGLVVRILGQMGVGVSVNFWKVTSNFYQRGNREQFFVAAYLTQEF